MTTEGATSENYNIKFENGTLILNGANITGAELSSANVGFGGNCGILAEDGLTIQLFGDNSVIAGGSSSNSYGIAVYNGKLTICGNGTLTAKGGTTTSDATTSCGIGASQIAISSGRITAVGGAGRNSSFGLYAWADGVTIEGGSVTAVGGTCDDEDYNSYGISLRC